MTQIAKYGRKTVNKPFYAVCVGSIYGEKVKSDSSIMERTLKVNQRLLNIFRALFMTSVLLFALYYSYINLDSFYILFKVDYRAFFVMLASTLFFLYASAVQNAILIRAFGVPISNWESFGLTNVSSFFSLFLPQGAILTKAVYLKQRYGVPYSKSPAVFLGLLVVFLVIGAGILFITNLSVLLMGNRVPIVFWAITFCATASGLLFWIEFPKGSILRFRKIGKLISNFSEGWKSLIMNRSCLIKTSAWQMAIFLSSGVLVTTAYYSLGIKINPMLGISISLFASFANLVVVIPGNIGVQEIVYGYFTVLSGVLFSQGIAVSVLIRGVGLLLTLVLAPISWYLLFYRKGIRIETIERI